MTKIQLDWVSFYTVCASKLLPFRNDRPHLITKIKKAFTEIGAKFPTTEKGDLRRMIMPRASPYGNNGSNLQCPHFFR